MLSEVIEKLVKEAMQSKSPVLKIGDERAYIWLEYRAIMGIICNDFARDNARLKLILSGGTILSLDEFLPSDEGVLEFMKELAAIGVACRESEVANEQLY